MEHKKTPGEIFIQLLSYILVAACAVLITLKVTDMNSSKLSQLENIIEEKFIGEYEKTVVEDAAADAMVRALGDRWSFYVPADQYAEFNEQKTNSYVGIGITIRMTEDDSGAEIERVEPEGPAQNAGILPGDIIVKIEDQQIAGLNTADMKHMIQGQPGTQVNVTVLRDGAELTFPVTRSEIAVTVAKGQMLEGNVGLVTIANFNENCAKETIDAAQQLIDDGAESLIFDVRNNGGGFVTEMVKILDYLLPEGEVFRSVDYAGKELVETSDASCVEMPMAVLINGNSYSAAEFFAAALEEYDWAVTAGEPTSGKGRFQYTLRLKDGSAVNLSVGEYETPNGVNLAEAGGLIPQIQTPVDEETQALIYAHAIEPEQDPQIQAAVEVLKAQKSK